MIAVYGIDRALLAQSDLTSDTVGDRVVVLDAPYALDKAGLLSSVACQMRCRAVQRSRYSGALKEISLHLFGYDSDLLRKPAFGCAGSPSPSLYLLCVLACEPLSPFWPARLSAR